MLNSLCQLKGDILRPFEVKRPIETTSKQCEHAERQTRRQIVRKMQDLYDMRGGSERQTHLLLWMDFQQMETQADSCADKCLP